MRRIIFLFLVLFIGFSVKAQSYFITFSGSGQSAAVDSVWVKNIESQQTLILSGSDTLHLLNPLGIKPVQEQDQQPLLYPNPTTGSSILEFYSTGSGEINIEIMDLTVKILTGINGNYPAGTHQFNLSGLKGGIYLVRVITPIKSFANRVVSVSETHALPQIRYNGVKPDMPFNSQAKSTRDIHVMNYNDGERLVFTATSGIYSHTSSLVPTQSQNIDFEFIECADYDGNQYGVVTIGEQVWMAENLKTTHYQNGVPIENPVDNYLWPLNTTGAYCWPENNISWKEPYGAFYNWFAVTQPHGLCPEGWYLPSEEEWLQLIDYLGGGNSPNGNYLKSCRQILSPLGGDCETYVHPRWHVNVADFGNDKFGFSVVPGGARYTYGDFLSVGHGGKMWSATENDDENAWLFRLGYYTGEILWITNNKHLGLSVRCIRNNPPMVSTTAVNSITSVSAKSGGMVLSNNGAEVTVRGVVWSKSEYPTIEDHEGMSTDSNGTGTFASNLYGLEPGTIYYVRAYAINTAGVAYGEQIEFTTQAASVSFGFYVVGSATPYSVADITGRFTQGINEFNQQPRPGMWEKYCTILEGSDGFNIVKIEGNMQTVYGPASNQFIDLNGEWDQPWITIQKGNLGTTGVFSVPSDGLYHITIDLQTNTYLIAPVPYWGMIGSALPSGWNSDDQMPVAGDFNLFEMCFAATDVSLNTGEFKFRYGAGWRILILESVVNVNTNFGGLLSGTLPELTTTLIPGGQNYLMTPETKGLYDVELNWNAIDGFTSLLTRTGDIPPVEYNDTELGLIGSSLLVNGIPWGWELTYQLHLPMVQNGTDYYWTWTNIEIAAGGNGFRIREDNTWLGLIIGRNSVNMAGAAASNFPPNPDGNFIATEHGFFDMELHIDAVLEEFTFTVNGAGGTGTIEK
jgi:uncharacterized protein (TIGR02145 family)